MNGEKRSSSSSSDNSFHEASEDTKRRCHRSNSPPTSSNTSDGSFHEAFEEQVENNQLENVSPLPEVDSLDSDDSSQEHEIEGIESEETGGDDIEVADNDSDDDDDEDEEEEEEDDELVALRARREETQKPVERPIVLSKPSSKPRYNFIQEYISLRQNTLLPQTFRSRRCGDLDLVQRFELAQKLEGHTGCVNAIHFNERGDRLASGSDDLDIYVWDWQKGKKQLSFKSGHTANVFQSKFLPLSGDTLIATTSRDGQVRLAELSSTGTCRSTKKVAMHKRASHKLALLEGHKFEFLSGGEDGLMIHIDIRQPKPNELAIQRSEKNERPVPIYSVHANPVLNHLVATAGSDQFVRLFDRRYLSQENSKPFQTFVPRHLATKSSIHITCAVFSNNGQEIIATYSDEDIFLFHTFDTGDDVEYVKRYQGHCNSQTVKGVNFYGPNCEFVVSGSDCGNIFFWDKEGEDIVHMVKGDENGVVNCLEPHPNLPMLATSGLDDEVKIWTPTSQTKVDQKTIEETVMKNADRSSQPNSGSMIGGQMLWQILRHIQRSERRRARAANRESGAENGEENVDSDEDSDNDSEGTSEDEDQALQCAQS